VFVTIKPAIPALNLGWNTNTLATDGTLRVSSVPTPRPTIGSVSVSGSSLILRASNGVPDWPCLVLGSTNVGLPLVQWQSLATNRFDASGLFSFTNLFSPTDPQRCFQLQLF